jgi:hypothetical protein
VTRALPGRLPLFTATINSCAVDVQDPGCLADIATSLNQSLSYQIVFIVAKTGGCVTRTFAAGKDNRTAMLSPIHSNGLYQTGYGICNGILQVHFTLSFEPIPKTGLHVKPEFWQA